MNTLATQFTARRLRRSGMLLLAVLALAACSDGGGAGAPQVNPGPAPANGNVPAPTPLPAPTLPNYYTRAITATASITGATIASPTTVEFSLVDGDGIALTGLTSANVRFHIAKLIPAADGDSSHWQSYINRNKHATVSGAPQSSAIQATSESGGTLVDHGDGTYTYTSRIDVRSVTTPTAVVYEPNLTHRVGFQFSGGPALNPTYDWVPASNATSGIETRDVVDVKSCNACHNPLAMHGGGRIDTKLCVMCHNPGTHEPNSGEDVDMKVMVHRIHMGSQLPSVQAGGEFVIYGYRDAKLDFSDINYPQPINNCAKCHAGSSTIDDPVVAKVQTSEGDNWAEVPTIQACGSCHDDVDFATHKGGQIDNSGCQSCHSTTGIAGSITAAHANETMIAGEQISVNILSVTNTAPGQFPVVKFSVTNPAAGNAFYNIKTDPAWTSGRLSLALAWDTRDFTNTGVAGRSTYATTNALTAATIAHGDGTFTVTSGVKIPDGTAAPFRAASGSGMAIFEGRYNIPTGRASFYMEPTYFSINEPNGQAHPRRQVVASAKCNACHGLLNFHGGSRANPEAQCQGCHNPRFATTSGISLDFKRLIHGIHAAAVRTDPLTIGNHVFDTSVVHFPGVISDCHTCHENDSFKLPLPANVLASTIDLGANQADPADDTMITATASVCSACHDSSLARSHMVQNGADFTATEATIAAGVSTETCAICHGDGRIVDVQTVHHDPKAIP